MSPAASGGPDFLSLFATPIWAADLIGAERFNGELGELLLAEEQRSPGTRRSNVGGWHSADNLAARPEPCLRAVLDAMVTGVRALTARLAEAARALPLPGHRFELHAWGLILRSGDYAVVHDHGDSHWSAIYWVDAGDDDPLHPESGRLVFVDPRRRGRPTPAVELFSPVAPVKPSAGALIVFPGWLQHYLHPYRGTRPRISISCNVLMIAE